MYNVKSHSPYFTHLVIILVRNINDAFIMVIDFIIATQAGQVKVLFSVPYMLEIYNFYFFYSACLDTTFNIPQRV